MTERPFFLSRTESGSDLLPFSFSLMNGTSVHLFLSFVPEDLVLFSSENEIPCMLNGKVLILDLEGQSGFGTLDLTFSSVSCSFSQTYHIVLTERVTLKDVFGEYRSEEKKKDSLSIFENKKGKLTFHRLLSSKEICFDVLSLDEEGKEIRTSVFSEDGKKCFLLLSYDFNRDGIYVTYIEEYYSDDDATSRVLLGKDGGAFFSRIR